MLFELVGHPFPLLGIGGGLFLDGDIGPGLGVFGVDAEPFLETRFGIGLDGLDRAAERDRAAA